jgi:hypothetical protein
MPADSNRVGYLKAIACFVDSFVVLLIFCKFSDPLYTLGLVFSNSLLMILFAYIFLGVHGLIRHDERRLQQQRLASQKALSPDDKKRSLFRRFSFQFANAMNEKRTSLWIPVIVVFVIYLVIATVLVLHLPSNRGSYLVSQVILWLVFWLIDRFRFRFESSAQWLAFRVRYVMMQFLFIVIIAIIPATVFFRITYNQEKKLEWKFRMLDFAQQMVSKEKVAPECSGAGFADFSYMQSYFLPFGKDTIRIGEMPAADREQPFDDIYDRVRPVFAEIQGASTACAPTKAATHCTDGNTMQSRIP